MIVIKYRRPPIRDNFDRICVRSTFLTRSSGPALLPSAVCGGPRPRVYCWEERELMDSRVTSESPEGNC
jgi:hypothetical protein